jgi:hypothetical protein
MRTAALALLLVAAPCAAQAPGEGALRDAARQVESCDSVVLVRCAPAHARDPAQALAEERVQARRKQSRRAEIRHDGPEFDAVEIYADLVAGAREERWRRFSGEVHDAQIPSCVGQDALAKAPPLPLGGLLAIPLWGITAAMGRCH